MQNASDSRYLARENCHKRTPDNASQSKVFKIIIVGDSSVGKTCLTYRFCEGKFLSKSDATIGVDFHEKTVQIGNDLIKLQLWDTAGLEKFRKSMVKQYYRHVNAVVIVYDMTKYSTFQSVDGWVAECEEQGLDREIPRVLVGTHCDCSSKIIISTSSAQRLADKHGMPLFETSAMLDSESETVDAIFLTLAHKIHSQQTFRIASVENSPIKLQRSPNKTQYKYSNCNNKCC